MITIDFPTKIVIGKTVINDAVDELSSKFKKLFIVTGGKKTCDSKSLKKFLQELEKKNISYELLSGVSSNPTYEVVQEGVSAFKNAGSDCIVTIGGGSVHDSGKLIAILVKQQLQVEDLFVENQGFEKISPDIVPVYTIPTLAGTGAEISPASLLRHNKHKRIVFSPYLFPKVAFYDLETMHINNGQLCLLTGFDAYVQSLEAYVSNQANIWSDMFAKDGMKNALQALYLLSKDGNSFEAKEKLVIASIQGLLAVSKSSVGAIHALSDPLSGIFNTHHGKALALLASTVVEINIQNGCSRYQKPAELFNVIYPGDYNAKNLPSLIEKFLKDIAPSLRDNVPNIASPLTKIETLVSDSTNPDMFGNPVELANSQIEKIFKISLNLD